MSVPSRPTKPNGSTDCISGEELTPTIYNGDLNPIYTLLNGGLQNDNMAASAGIDASKIDDHSDSATTMATVTSPGGPDTESLATSLEGEIERLRFAVGRIALGSTGSNVKRNDGSAKSVPWYDRPARAGSYIANGSFEIQSGGAGTAPDRWTTVGTPTTLELTNADVTNGDGKAVRIVADAAGEGIQQSLAGLPASAQFLLTARVKVAVGTVRMVTTGADAASEWSNVEIASTSATATTLNAVIATDATPTAIVVQFLSNANLDDFQVDNVRLQRIAAEVVGIPGYVAVVDSSTNTGAIANGSMGAFPSGDAITAAVTVPGPGYSIRVSAVCSFDTAANAATVVCKLGETPSTSGTTTYQAIASAYAAANQFGSVSLRWVQASPVVGDTYTYTIQAGANAASVTANSSAAAAVGETLNSILTVELIPPG